MRYAWFPIVISAMVATSGGQGWAQRPQLGLGGGGGLVLGSYILEHEIPVGLGDATVLAQQRVLLTEITGGSAQGEWFATPHVALRGHVTHGAGSLVPSTWTDAGEFDVAGLERGFGRVLLTTYDVSLSVWPFVPRSQGFAPFFTVGIGTASFDLRQQTGERDFFRGRGARRLKTLAFGAGADMAVWSSVMLRVEAVNHRADSPLAPEDFALDETSRERLRQTLDDDVNNVRLSMGAYVYVP